MKINIKSFNSITNFSLLLTFAISFSIVAYLHYQISSNTFLNQPVDITAHAEHTSTTTFHCSSYFYPPEKVFHPHHITREEDINKLNTIRSEHDSQSICPHLFILGARKSGTTSIYNYIARHPEFYSVKLEIEKNAGEIHFFSGLFASHSWEYYDKFFNTSASRGKIKGEASVSYLVDCHAPFRIRCLCGLKSVFVILLRNPIDRLVSTFKMKMDKEGRSFIKDYNQLLKRRVDKAILAWKTALSEHISGESQNLIENRTCLFRPAINQIYEGCYSIFLERWFKYFPRNNFLIWKSEEFFAYPSLHFKQLIAKLNMTALSQSEITKITSLSYNVSPHPEILKESIMTSSEINHLQDIYSPFNNRLQQVIGKQFSWF